MPEMTWLGDPSGSPLVALHGNGASPQQWARLAAEALPWRRWICPTLPGHHGEPVAAGACTLDRLAYGVLAQMDSVGVARCDLVGSSLGARVAMVVARLAPDRVARLVLLDPPLMTADEWVRWRAQRGSLLTESVFDDLDTFVAYSSPHLPGAARQSARDEAAAVLVAGPDGRLRLRVDPGAYRGALDAIGQEPDGAGVDRSVVGAFGGQALLLVAMRSDVVSDTGRAALAAELGARLRVVELDSGHAILWDAYDWAAAAIVGFLGSERACQEA